MFARLYNAFTWSMLLSVLMFLNTWLEMRVNLGLVFFAMIADTVFFPGCSLTGYNPSYVFNVRDYLRGNIGDCGIITACCAKPLKLMGDTETFLRRIASVNHELDVMNAKTVATACQNCYRILKAYSEGRNILSIWPIIMEHGLPERLRGKYSGFEAAVQDSCTSTLEIAASVREILHYLGVTVREFSDAKMKCCGGSRAIIAGSSSFGHQCMRERANEAPCNVIVSYCASCRSAMGIDGIHRSIHILDLIFGNGEVSEWKHNLRNRLFMAGRLKEE